MDMNKIQSLFAKSAKRLQQGDAAAAKPGLLKVAKLIKDSPVVWYNLALSHQHLGEHAEAVGAYDKVLALNPEFIDAWVNLGVSYKALGDLDKAETAAERGMALDPNHPRTLNLLGTLAAERGDREKAGELLEKSLHGAPDFDDARFNMANVLVESGEDQRALEIAQPLIHSDPGKKEYRVLYGQILMGLKRNEEASAVISELEKEYPDDLDVLRLGRAFREVIRDHFGVIDVTEKLLDRVADDSDAWNSRGGAFFQLDSIDKAKACYERAIELDPDHAEYENNLGLAFSSLGDKENAERHYRRSLALNPRHAEAYRNIVTMKRFSSLDDADAHAIKELWDADDLDDMNTIKLSFALGKILDDCGDYGEAFGVYSRGNDLKFRESRIDLEQYFAHMDRFVEVFDRPPIVCSTVEPEIKPIFILGMPRSGTTLVEQIVSRHPLVFGCGELPCIERAINRIEKRSKPMKVYPDDFWDLEEEVLNGETLEYERWVKRLHDIHTPHITDKMPFNFVHVWLIKALFPHAPVVHCQRHPLDVITSNYFQLYGSDISFVYNLEALAQYYVRYYRLMEHWARVFGDGLVQIRYEDLVQDADIQTQRLIADIGLPWDDACFDPRKSDTAVRTASIWQVRQGIYTRSKERWRNYEHQLAPAIDILVGEGILERDLSVPVAAAI